VEFYIGEVSVRVFRQTIVAPAQSDCEVLDQLSFSSANNLPSDAILCIESFKGYIIDGQSRRRIR
jgi:hypothetical protein